MKDLSNIHELKNEASHLRITADMSGLPRVDFDHVIDLLEVAAIMPSPPLPPLKLPPSAAPGFSL